MKSHLETIAEIKDFITEMKKNKDFAGSNISLSKHPGKSYIIAKSYSKPMPICVLPVDLDYFDPMQKILIDEAVYEATYNKKMSPEEAEASIICKSE